MSNNNQSGQIISDISDGNATYFNFDKYSEVISDLILDSNNQTPFSIAIDGKWGSGKTSLLLNVKSRIEKSVPNTPNKRLVKTFWFNAWKFPEKDTLLAAIAYQLFNEKYQELIPVPWLKEEWNNLDPYKKVINVLIYPFQKFAFIIKKPTLWYNRICLLRSASDLTKFVTNGKTPDFYNWVKSPFYENKLSFYSEFERFLNLLLKPIVSKDPKISSKVDRSLVFFIDDLDRCSPENITNIISSIRLIFDQKGCIFVLGMDIESISTAIESYYHTQGYSNIKGKDFLKKFIQLRFNLPPIKEEDIITFIDEMIHPDIRYQSLLSEIINTIDNSPREIKRFFNDILLLKRISRSIVNEYLADELIIKWCLLLYLSEDLIIESKSDPNLLLLLQSFSKNKESALFNYKEYLEQTIVTINENGEIIQENINNNKFEKYKYNPKIISILNSGDFLFDRENIRNYVYISSFVRDTPIPTKNGWCEAWVDHSDHVKGNKILFGGSYTKTNVEKIKIWIFGPNSFYYDKIQSNDNNSFKYELSANLTENLYSGEYYVLIQFSLEYYSTDFDLGKDNNSGFIIKFNHFNQQEEKLLDISNLNSSWNPLIAAGKLVEEFNKDQNISYLKLQFRLHDGDVTIVVSGNQSYIVGNVIKFSGTNSDSRNTYLFIHGENIPEQGGSLTNPTEPVVNDFYDTFVSRPVDNHKLWDYNWDTKNVPLKPGKYTIYALSSPKDRFHLNKTHYDNVTIIIKE